MSIVQSIIMYTISNDETRNDFVQNLEQIYGEDLIPLDQSTYGVPILTASPSDELDSLKTICRNIVLNNHHDFAVDDTIKYCFSAAMANISSNDPNYDKIIVEDVLEGIQPAHRRPLFH